MKSEFTSGTDEETLQWAAERIDGVTQFRSDAVYIAHWIDGSLAGVVVFDTFSEGECCIHVASDGSKRWVTRDFIVRTFAYPFIQCGFRRITGLVAAKNEKALKFDLGLGFVQEGVMRKALPDDDIIILGMLREECRHLPKGLIYGQGI